MWFQFLTSRNEQNSFVIYVLSQYLARNINANLAKKKENTENIKERSSIYLQSHILGSPKNKTYV